MKKHLFYILFIMVLTGLAGCGKEETATIPDLLEPVGVHMDTAIVEKGDMAEFVVFSGEVVPHVEGLCFEEDGYLEKVHVAVGDVVTKGDILVSLDEEKLDEEIAALEESIASIKTLGELSDQKALADIKATEIELQMMWKTGEVYQWKKGPSLLDYNIKYVGKQKKELTLEQTKELRELELKEKQRQLSALKAKKGNNKLVAPFDGRVVYVAEFDQKGTVKEYNTIICLADESRLRLMSEFITESEIDRADYIYAHIMDKDYDITYVPYTSTEYVEMVLAGDDIKTKFDFCAVDEALKSGQYASVIMSFNNKKDVLMIPSNALYRDSSGHCVYLIEDGHRVRQSVKVGALTDISVEILEGLKEGDMVYVKD